MIRSFSVPVATRIPQGSGKEGVRSAPSTRGPLIVRDAPAATTPTCGESALLPAFAATAGNAPTKTARPGVKNAWRRTP